MADIITAQNLVTSVLENAGYLTQERILERMSDLFGGVATILYILAALGAILSIVLFGSYRAARYLLLGPTLYLFLIMPSEPGQGIPFQTGPNKATDVRDIRVSRAYKAFTTTINGIVSNLVAGLVPHVDDPQFPFLGRARAYEMLLNLEVENKDLLEAFDGLLFSRCQEMMDASIALASPELLQNRIDGLLIAAQSSASDANRESLQLEATRIANQRMVLLERRARVGKQYVRATPGLKRFIDLKLSDTQNTATADKIRAIFTKEGVDYKSGSEVHMTCEAAWQVTQQAIWEHADSLTNKLLGDFTGTADEKTELGQTLQQGTEQARRRKLCVELARKLGQFQASDSYATDAAGNYMSGDQCDLPAVAGLFLMRNAIRNLDTNKRIQYHHDSIQALASVKDGQIIAQETDAADGVKARRLRLVGSMYDYKMKWIEGDNGDTGYLAAAFIDEDDPDAGEQWLPFKRVSEITGHFGAGFKEHQSYQTRGLRQSLFTIATQLPYYRGYLLYLLSIAWPFACAVVVVPGKAQNIVFFPLAWLWIQSWSIGFVLVDILDKIIWNMFPHTDLPFEVNGVPLDQVELPNLVYEAFKFDPTFNVHAYYRLESTAFGFVVAGSGYAILKARRGILAAFTGSMLNQGTDALQRAEGAYGVSTMNYRLRQQVELAGAAKLSKVADEATMRGQGREDEAENFGLIRGGASGASGVIDTLSKANSNSNSARRLDDAGQSAQADNKRRSGRFEMGKNASDAVASGIKSYNNAWVGIMKAKTSQDAEYAASFDPRFGRWGAWSMMADATTAAMDAEGGFEINNQHTGSSAWRKRIELMSAELKVLIESGDEFATSVISNSMNYMQSKRGPLLGKSRAGKAVSRWIPDLVGAEALYEHVTGHGMRNEWVKEIFPTDDKYDRVAPSAMYNMNFGPRKIVPKEYFYQEK